MNKFHNSKIYKIVNSITDDIYIGSTTEKLSKRLSRHKHKSTIYPNRLLYTKFNEYGKDNFKIELVESVSCDNAVELTKLEEHYRQTMNANLNMRRCRVV